MNPDPILQPMPRPLAEAATVSLDQRIALAEQRLLARQDRLQQRAQMLGQRLRRAITPRHLVMPVLGVLLSLFTTWKLLRASPAPSAAQAPAPRSGRWGFMLALLAALVRSRA